MSFLGIFQRREMKRRNKGDEAPEERWSRELDRDREELTRRLSGENVELRRRVRKLEAILSAGFRRERLGCGWSCKSCGMVVDDKVAEAALIDGWHG